MPRPHPARASVLASLPQASSPRARETRSRLLTAGRTAFAEKGLDGTNLKSDILEPAGVSVGSFYHQFSDKTELLLVILAEHSEAFRLRLAEAQRPRPGRSLEELVRDAYEVLFADAEENYDLLLIQLRERFSGSERVREFLRADREQWIASLTESFAVIDEAVGASPTDRGAAEMILALAHGAIGRFVETPPTRRRAARRRLVDNLVRFSIGGVAALDDPSEE